MKEIINKIKNKKKKKGFTLVELLAVIVILAVIMILTIPAVLNNVGEAKKKSFETVGKTLIKYIDDNYQNCKLGNKDIAKYDESLFDEGTCDFKEEIKNGASKDWISNAGYDKKDIDEVKVSINSEGKVDIMVKPSEDGEFKDSEDFTTIVLNYDPSCWNYSGSTINGFNGLDAEGNILEKCNGFAKKDDARDYHLEIPEKIGETTMTKIGPTAFAQSIVSFVIIPESIEEIMYNAFVNSSLKSVKFSGVSKLKKIGDHVFYKTKLEKIVIPASVQTIGMRVFHEVSTLKKVEFEQNSELVTVGISSFAYTNISSVVIPKSVETIGDNAFGECKNLTNVEFEQNSNLKTISSYAFYNTGIISILIPTSVTTIGQKAFTNNSNLTTIEFCGSLTAGNTDWYNSSTTVGCSNTNEG